MRRQRTCLLLALSAAFAFGGCGDGDEERPAAAAKTATPAITPFPSVNGAELKAGTAYTTQQFKPPITITPSPGEWIAFTADSPEHFSLNPKVDSPVKTAALAFHRMTKVFDPEKGGKIPGDAVEGPEDFAAWLSDHPHLRTTKPEPVEALGLKGVQIDMRWRSTQPNVPDECGKFGGDCVILFLETFEPVNYPKDTFTRWLVLEDPNGDQLVVEMFVAPEDAFSKVEKQFQDTLDSAKVG